MAHSTASKFYCHTPGAAPWARARFVPAKRTGHWLQHTRRKDHRVSPKPCEEKTPGGQLKAPFPLPPRWAPRAASGGGRGTPTGCPSLTRPARPLPGPPARHPPPLPRRLQGRGWAPPPRQGLAQPAGQAPTWAAPPPAPGGCWGRPPPWRLPPAGPCWRRAAASAGSRSRDGQAPAFRAAGLPAQPPPLLLFLPGTAPAPVPALVPAPPCSRRAGAAGGRRPAALLAVGPLSSWRKAVCRWLESC